MNNLTSSNTAVLKNEVYETIDQKKKDSCKKISNLYSIVLVLDAIQSAYNQGRIDMEEYEKKKKSLYDQFAGSMKEAEMSGEMTSEQFYKDYFPNGEYALGRDLTSNKDKQIMQLRDDAIKAINTCNAALKIKLKRGIKESIDNVEKKIQIYLASTHKAFNYSEFTNEMRDHIEETDDEDDAAISNQSCLNACVNCLDDLQNAFCQVYDCLL